MKTYAIVGNQYEGLYTKPWSEVQKYTQTKPAPKYKGFTSYAAAKQWFDENQAAITATYRNYETVYDGEFKREAQHYYIFTDGGSRNTGNVAGGHVKATDLAAFAVVIFAGLDNKNPLYKNSVGFFGKTNNEMEVQALLAALQQAQKVAEPVTIVSDSKYVLDTVTNWMYNWQSNGWTKKSGEIANLNLWQQIYDLVQQQKDHLAFIWVKGHATSAGNQLVDQLLNQAMDELK
ncbi:RNase HI [Weissella kandleri]|uniref:ribonuclease H n=1 Tax=Weissella kandleri TaxID=1616 RepID=A0A0R2JBN7_9LACO|nr:viroplasmin family protein [Weissella kandleri]KRN74707.1 RNase HI [Weissella kandleri]